MLNGKLKIVQNQGTQSDSESEESEIDDEESDFEWMSKTIQWNETLRNVLNGKLKIVQNQGTQSDSESEESEIDDEESDFENYGTSKKTAAINQLQHPRRATKPTYGREINPGEKQTNNKITENEKIGRSNCESRQPNRCGGLHIQKNFWA